MASKGDDHAGTYEDLLQKSVGELRHFLSMRAMRGISTTGSKPELVARAFVATEERVPLKLSELEQKEKLQKEYSCRIKELDIVDPNTILDEMWMDDVTKWPKIDLSCIFSFILEKKEFDQTYIGKYKTYKAYSYFSSGFVGPIYHHFISNDRVIVKSSVVPSQRVRDQLWPVWLVLRTSGEILGGWCGCTAGYSQACNHIMAILYKLEHASIMNFNDPSCTDLPCTWNHKTFKELKPQKISSMIIRQSNRIKAGDAININSEYKSKFDPRREGERNVTDEQVSSLLAKWKLVEPNAVAYKAFPKSVNLSSNLPPSIQIQAEKYAGDHDGDEITLVNGFIEKLSLSVTGDTVITIEKGTVNQSKSVDWHEQRVGRLTSSFFHDIHTKVEALSKNPGKPYTITKLLSRVLDPQSLDHIPSIQWGQEHETDAKLALEREMTGRHHKFKIKNVGLVIDESIPYLAASPDGIAVCKCCSKACVELKCPYSLRNKSIDEGWHETQFLERGVNQLQLKKSHKYYTQVQGQMAITKCQKCFFLVWSPIGKPHIEEINFDVKFWERVRLNLCTFFKSHMARVLLGIREIFYCPICNKVILEEGEFEDSKENSVQCMTCLLWYHWGCCGMIEIKDDDDWVCDNCKKL